MRKTVGCGVSVDLELSRSKAASNTRIMLSITTLWEYRAQRRHAEKILYNKWEYNNTDGEAVLYSP